MASILLPTAVLLQVALILTCVLGYALTLTAATSGDRHVMDMGLGVSFAIQSMLLQAGVCVLSYPPLLRGELDGGGLFFASIGFVIAIVAVLGAAATTRSFSRMMSAQIVVSSLGLVCLWVSYGLAA